MDRVYKGKRLNAKIARVGTVKIIRFRSFWDIFITRNLDISKLLDILKGFNRV